MNKINTYMEEIIKNTKNFKNTNRKWQKQEK